MVTLRCWNVLALLACVFVAVMAAGAEGAVMERRQQGQAVGGAALGGGNGAPQTTTATTPASISGYTPPPTSNTPEPTNFSQGSIVPLSAVSGYTEAMQFARSGSMPTVPPTAASALVAVALAVAVGAMAL